MKHSSLRDHTDKMKEDLIDCGSIASSAIVFAVDRSQTINAPELVTFVMLKKLTEQNIKAHVEKQLKDEDFQAHCTKMGGDPGVIYKEAIEAIEEVIDHYFEIACKKVEVKR